MTLRYYVKSALEQFEKKVRELESSTQVSEVLQNAWSEVCKNFNTWTLDLSDVEALSLAASLKATQGDISSTVYSTLLAPMEEFEIPYDEQMLKEMKSSLERLLHNLHGHLKEKAKALISLIDTAIKAQSSIVIRPLED